jgi:hypothetical protein
MELVLSCCVLLSFLQFYKLGKGGAVRVTTKNEEVTVRKTNVFIIRVKT